MRRRFDDVIQRLTARDKWHGFGALAGEETDTREGMQRMRERTRDGIERDVEEPN